jgi:ABC-2 type transport system ATP-binding protein
MIALEIQNLSKKLGEFSLENINLSLPQGYIMGYIGQNGAGKTTTINLIMEHLQKESGSIKVFGKAFYENEEEFKDLIGYIPDECFFPNSFNLNDVIEIMKTFYKTFSLEKFKSLAKKWALPENKKIKDFSKGMKVKLMFATVLSRDTRVLILDEPTSGLDPVMRSEILELLQDYISDGTRSVLFSTHVMSDLDKIADFLCFIEDGKIVFNGTKDEILEKYSLVKGDVKDITDEAKKNLIGMKTNEFGFCGLTFKKNSTLFGKGFLLENPSIDDIIVHHINGVKGGF